MAFRKKVHNGLEQQLHCLGDLVCVRIVVPCGVFQKLARHAADNDAFHAAFTCLTQAVAQKIGYGHKTFCRKICRNGLHAGVGNPLPCCGHGSGPGAQEGSLGKLGCTAQGKAHTGNIGFMTERAHKSCSAQKGESTLDAKSLVEGPGSQGLAVGNGDFRNPGSPGQACTFKIGSYHAHNTRVDGPVPFCAVKTVQGDKAHTAQGVQVYVSFPHATEHIF